MLLAKRTERVNMLHAVLDLSIRYAGKCRVVKNIAVSFAGDQRGLVSCRRR